MGWEPFDIRDVTGDPEQVRSARRVVQALDALPAMALGYAVGRGAVRLTERWLPSGAPPPQSPTALRATYGVPDLPPG